MSPKEAIELLDSVASLFKGDRQTHIKLQMAISVLQDLVADTEAKRKEEIGPKKK